MDNSRRKWQTKLNYLFCLGTFKQIFKSDPYEFRANNSYCLERIAFGSRPKFFK